jgi:outer membrane protein insertion porin family
VRGYRMLSISPTQRVPSNPNDPMAQLATVATGGNKQAILNVELEFPLVPSAGIKGVLFADAGNVFATGSWKDSQVPYSLYKSAGFGFRWFSPMGPLRFEWGIPLNRRKDPVSGAYIDQPLDFQFTIGNFF